MSALLIFHPLLRRAWNAVFPTPGRRSVGGPNRLDQRASYDYAFAVLFLFVLHGLSTLKIFALLFLNYQVATKLPRKYVPAATWLFNLTTLFANDLCKGYQFRNMASYIAPPTNVQFDHGMQAVDSTLMGLGAWMDGYRGLLARWEVLFNITILRLISFNLDFYWSVDRRSSDSLEVRPHHTKPVSCLIRQRRSSWTQAIFPRRIAS